MATAELEKDDRLRIWDWYTIQLGRKSEEEFAPDSLKIPDVSIEFSKNIMRRPPEPDRLIVVDDESFMARHNDEKAWVEFEITRDLPANRMRKMTAIHGFTRGVHSEWAYKSLEAAHEAVIDFKLDDTSDPPQNLVRVRNFRNASFDGRWHQLKIGKNFEVTLEK